MVLIIKPSVGLTLLTSSSIIFLTIVVFPALSRPLQKVSGRRILASGKTHSINILISLSLRRAFLKIDNILIVGRYSERKEKAQKGKRQARRRRHVLHPESSAGEILTHSVMRRLS